MLTFVKVDTDLKNYCVDYQHIIVPIRTKGVLSCQCSFFVYTNLHPHPPKLLPPLFPPFASSQGHFSRILSLLSSYDERYAAAPKSQQIQAIAGLMASPWPIAGGVGNPFRRPTRQRAQQAMKKLSGVVVSRALGLFQGCSVVF